MDKGLRSEHSILFALFMAMALLVSCNGRKSELQVIKTWPDGTPKLVFEYKKGDTIDPHYEIHYYRNGNKRIAGPLKHGLRHGKWQAWFEDGTLWSEGTYVDGKENGMKKIYYPNGNLYYKGIVTDGQRTGVWEFFDNEGQKIKEVDYDALNNPQEQD